MSRLTLNWVYFSGILSLPVISTTCSGVYLHSNIVLAVMNKGKSSRINVQMPVTFVRIQTTNYMRRIFLPFYHSEDSKGNLRLPNDSKWEIPRYIISVPLLTCSPKSEKGKLHGDNNLISTWIECTPGEQRYYLTFQGF